MEKLEHLYPVGRNVKWDSTMENSMVILKKFEKGLPYDSAILLLYISERFKAES